MVLRFHSRYPNEMDYFEDIELDREIVIGRHTPSREEIVSFARDWDPQPFHIDEDAARASLLGGLSASSCHTYAISSLIYSRSAHKVRSTAMMGLEMKFPTPVRPDEELTLIEVFLDKRVSESRPGQGVVHSLSRILNERGDEAMRMSSHFLVERRPVGSAPV